MDEAGMESTADDDPATLRYVALGDSYTIGTAVRPDDRWPDRLVAALGPGTPGAPSLRLTANLAVNGYASANVLARQVPQLDSLRPQFASLLVGVNDVVHGVPPATFERHAVAILGALVERLPRDRIVVVSTPDYTVTPRGGDFGPRDLQAAGISESNAILERLTRAGGIAWVDIHDLSLRAAKDRALVAADGLHPSGAQYALWVERIRPVVERLLGRVGPDP